MLIRNRAQIVNRIKYYLENTNLTTSKIIDKVATEIPCPSKDVLTVLESSEFSSVIDKGRQDINTKSIALFIEENPQLVDEADTVEQTIANIAKVIQTSVKINSDRLDLLYQTAKEHLDTMRTIMSKNNFNRLNMSPTDIDRYDYSNEQLQLLYAANKDVLSLSSLGNLLKTIMPPKDPSNGGNDDNEGMTIEEALKIAHTAYSQYAINGATELNTRDLNYDVDDDLNIHVNKTKADT